MSTGLRAGDVVRLLAVVLALAALLTAAAIFLPEEEAIVDAGVRVLRVMTSNPAVCLPENGEYHDWIELANVSQEEVDMTGWKLTNQLDVRTGYVFPELTLSPGESAIVYAAPQPEGGTDAMFCGFPLSADGGSLVLLDSHGRYCDVLDVPAISAGSVYALNAETGVYKECSPFEKVRFGRDLSAELTPAHQANGVCLSELMASNGSTLKDDTGAYSDWIEIFNGSAAAVDLTGWSLTDDMMNRRKWVFPETVLGAGEYLTVFPTGAESGDGDLHAAFKLSAEGETVLLCNPDGHVVSYMKYGALEMDQSLVRGRDGKTGKSFLPSPGYANTAEGARMAVDEEYLAPVDNELQLYINEVVCSAEGIEDWLELYNASGAAIDLSGYGLSDNPNRPRKWQFPEGASIPAGGYLAVKLAGSEGEEGLVNGIYQTNFALNVQADEVVLLATAEGEIIDRMLLSGQRRGISYGRAAGAEEYRYFRNPTPNAANDGAGYRYCAMPVEFSVQGGVQDGPVELALSAQEGMTIYYTTDGTNPTLNSTVYTGPATISKNMVVKAVAWRDGAIESEVCGHTYVFSAEHNGYVVMVSGKRSQLNGSSGTLNTGVGVGVDVYAEIYDGNGERVIAQECYLHLNGRSTRLNFDQKAFRLVAKKEYGDNRFKAALFSNRDYEEYKSFIVRCAGQDNRGAFMRDPLLTGLARNTSVMYQEHETAVVYINGQYWGQYYLRERITPESICQFEGWENPDNVDFLEGRGAVVQGSNESLYEMMSFIRRNSLKSDANLEKLRRYMDVENYLEYVMLEMYSGNQDLNNQRMYRNAVEGDGQWHWILYDLDLAFRSTGNVVRQWASDTDKVGSITWQSNEIFKALMDNAYARDYFLTRFGELMATDMSSESVVGDIMELYEQLEPEMERHSKRWNWSTDTWMQKGSELISYANKRPSQLITWIVDKFHLSDEQTQHYFGAAIEKING